MRKTYSITYSSKSIEDLQDLHYYISHRLEAPQAAQRTVARIRTAIRGLKTLPFRHGLAIHPSLQREGVRSLTVDNYIVLYKANEPTRKVTIYRIVYRGRDLSRLDVSEPSE